jgi:hypothetical protein
MSSPAIVIHSVSLYQDDWDIVDRENRRLHGLGASATGRSSAIRHIIREWDMLQRQVWTQQAGTQQEPR